MQVHRCRFVDWVPEAINCLAYCPDGEHIAVARKNGDVEMWNTESKWFCQYTIPGHTMMHIRNMIWLEDKETDFDDNDENVMRYRLLCSGLDGKVFEVDFKKLSFKNHSDSYGGCIWSMALQPGGNLLALACEDGSIRLFDVSYNQINYIRGIQGSDSRILSICWCPNENGVSQCVFTGGADSSIRKWNIITGTIENRVTVERRNKQNTCIWALAPINEYICAIGDSLGHMQIWNLHLGVLIQSFSKHEGDVLTIYINNEKNMIYTAGVDGQVILYELIHITKESTQWVYSYSHKAHSHDIQSLSFYDDILISGGLDTYIVRYTMSTYKNDRPLKVMPHTTHQYNELYGKYLLVQYTHDINIYCLGEGKKDNKKTMGDIENTKDTIQRYSLYQNYRQILSFHMDDIGNINKSSIYVKDKHIYIAVNTDIAVKLFDYSINDNKLTSIPVPEQVNKTRYIYIQYLHNQPYLLCVADNGYIYIYNQEFETIIKIPISQELVVIDEAGFKGPFVTVDISPDDNHIVIADIYNRVISIIIDINKKNYTVNLLYSSHVGIVYMKFFPNSKVVLIGLSDNTFVIYDVDKLSIASKYNYINSLLPKDISSKPLINGLIVTYFNKNILLFWSSDYILQINFTNRNTKGQQTKRSINSDNTVTPTSVKEFIQINRYIKEYQPLLYVGEVNNNQICVIEREWLDIVKALPPVFYKKRYGV